MEIHLVTTLRQTYRIWLIFPVYPRMTWCSNRRWILIMSTVRNLWISGPSLSKLEKSQRSSAFSNIKYNRAVVFLSELSIYASEYIFPETTTERLSQNLLNFLQGVRYLWYFIRKGKKWVSSLDIAVFYLGPQVNCFCQTQTTQWRIQRGIQDQATPGHISFIFKQYSGKKLVK